MDLKKTNQNLRAMEPSATKGTHGPDIPTTSVEVATPLGILELDHDKSSSLPHEAEERTEGSMMANASFSNLSVADPSEETAWHGATASPAPTHRCDRTEKAIPGSSVVSESLQVHQSDGGGSLGEVIENQDVRTEHVQNMDDDERRFAVPEPDTQAQPYIDTLGTSTRHVDDPRIPDQSVDVTPGPDHPFRDHIYRNIERLVEKRADISTVFSPRSEDTRDFIEFVTDLYVQLAPVEVDGSCAQCTEEAIEIWITGQNSNWPPI